MLGSKEIGFTVLSMSTSLIAVFIPILLMGGLVGRLFREFAITLSAAIAVSLVVSLTTTPMLAAKFLKPYSRVHKGWFYRMGERHLARLTAEYERGLRWVIRHQITTFIVFLLTFALNIYLFIIVPKGFFPLQDTGRLSGSLQTQQDASFLRTRESMTSIAETVQKDPGVENVLGFLGGGGPGGGASNSARMFVVLKPESERLKTGDTADKIINRLRPKTTNLPGVKFYPRLLAGASRRWPLLGRAVSVHPHGRHAGSSSTHGLRSSWLPCRSCPSFATSTPTRRTRASRPSSSSIATPPRASASARSPSTPRSLTPSASARSPPCTSS